MKEKSYFTTSGSQVVRVENLAFEKVLFTVNCHMISCADARRKILRNLVLGFVAMVVSAVVLAVVIILRQKRQDTTEPSSGSVSISSTASLDRPVGFVRLTPAEAISLVVSASVIFGSVIFVVTQLIRLCNHCHNRV